MLFVHLYEHGDLAVDFHRTYRRDIHLPSIAEIRRLCESEVMARGKYLHGASRRTHDSNGDKDSILPIVIAVEQDTIFIISITGHSERNRLSSSTVELVFPLFGEGKLLDRFAGDGV